MAAAYASGASNAVADGGATTHDSPNISGNSGDLVYCFIGNSGLSPAAPTGVAIDPAGANIAMTKIADSGLMSSFGWDTLWRVVLPSNVSAKPIRATWAANQNERAAAVWIGTGIDTTTPNGTIGENNQADTSPAATCTTTVGQLVLSFVGVHDAGPTSTALSAPSGTQRHSSFTSPDEYLGVGSQDQAASGTSTSPSWTISEAISRWYMVAIPLNDGAAAVAIDEPDWREPVRASSPPVVSVW